MTGSRSSRSPPSRCCRLCPPGSQLPGGVAADGTCATGHVHHDLWGLRAGAHDEETSLLLPSVAAPPLSQHLCCSTCCRSTCCGRVEIAADWWYHHPLVFVLVFLPLLVYHSPLKSWSTRSCPRVAICMRFYPHIVAHVHLMAATACQ